MFIQKSPAPVNQIFKFLKFIQPFESCFRLMNENAQEGDGNNIKTY